LIYQDCVLSIRFHFVISNNQVFANHPMADQSMVSVDSILLNSTVENCSYIYFVYLFLHYHLISISISKLETPWWNSYQIRFLFYDIKFSCNETNESYRWTIKRFAYDKMKTCSFHILTADGHLTTKQQKKTREKAFVHQQTRTYIWQKKMRPEIFIHILNYLFSGLSVDTGVDRESFIQSTFFSSSCFT